MRNFALVCVFIAFSMVLTPLVAITTPAMIIEPEKSTSPNSPSKEGEKTEEVSKIKVLISSSSEVLELNEEDYVFGAVAAEMPASFHEEALKAQAVACYTYALNMKEGEKDSPNPDLKGAHLTDSSSNHQGYISESACREKWGDKYDLYAGKIKKAIEAVQGQRIVYDGEPIVAAFHAISSGKTESANEVWNNDVPYLKPVLSTGDKLSPNYTTTTVFSKEQFKEMAATLGDISLDDDASKWVSEPVKSDSGALKSIKIGDKSFTGTQVRSAFSLRSNHISIEYKNDSFTFTVTGYGHGLGMSQYGADYMARQGSSWEEIIKHYYKDIEITNG